MKKILAIILGLLSILSFTSCKKENTKADVMSSFYAIDSVVNSLVKDTNITTDCLVKGTAEPHEYEPSVKDVAKLYDAKVIIFNGNDFEEFGNNLNNDILDKVVEVSDYLDVIPSDPHTFVSPKTMLKVVEVIKNTLIEIFSDYSEVINNNYLAYYKELEELDKKYDEFFESNQNKYVVSHDAYKYFARDYNLIIKSVLGMHEEEPTARAITEIEKYITTNNIKEIYGAHFEENEIVNKIASDLNLKVKLLYTGEMMDESNLDYLEITRKNLDIFRS